MTALSPLEGRYGALLSEEDYRDALGVSLLFGRVDVSVLWVVGKIFASASDGRVINGFIFLAHFLRLSQITQLSLYPDCDIAVVSVPSVLLLCSTPRYEWPYCYETTLKYLSLLTACGVFTKPPQKRGQGVVYCFPLAAYALLPERAEREIEKLTRKRAKVSRSTALARATVHCRPQEADLLSSGSGPGDARGEVEQAVQQVVREIDAVIGRCQGTALLPLARSEVARVLRERSPLFSLRGEPGVGEGMVDSLAPSSVGSRSAVGRPGRESTASVKNLPMSSEVVDSRALLTESVISDKKNTYISENILSEGARARADTPESAIVAGGAQMVDSLAQVGEGAGAEPLTLEAYLRRRFPAPDWELGPGESLRSHLAALLSYRVNRDTSKVGHYTNLLKQDIRALDLAIVDGLVRSRFPDAGRRPGRLRGGWITDRYQEYHAGVPAEAAIAAWAGTDYTYDQLDDVLDGVAQVRGPERRPHPREVIVDSAQLVDFWLLGGGSGLAERGYVYVDVDMDLCAVQDYHSLRQEGVVPDLLSDRAEPLAPEDSYEMRTYGVAQACDLEESRALLAAVPARVRGWVERLEAVLDPRREVVQVLLTTRLRRYVVEVSDLGDPTQTRVLTNDGEVRRFIDSWELALRSTGRSAGDRGRDDVLGEMVVVGADRPESRDRGRVTLRVGAYDVELLGSAGAFVQAGSGERFRLDGVVAGDAAAFVRCHPREVLALMGGSLEGGLPAGATCFSDEKGGDDDG